MFRLSSVKGLKILLAFVRSAPVLETGYLSIGKPVVSVKCVIPASEGDLCVHCLVPLCCLRSCYWTSETCTEILIIKIIKYDL